MRSAIIPDLGLGSTFPPSIFQSTGTRTFHPAKKPTDQRTCPADEIIANRLKSLLTDYKTPMNATQRMTFAVQFMPLIAYWETQPLVDQSQVPGLAKTEELLRECYIRYDPEFANA